METGSIPGDLETYFSELIKQERAAVFTLTL